VVPGLRPPAGRHRGQRALGESGFAHTDLDQQLRQHGIERIILARLTALGCVEGTGRWAPELAYAVTW
jgi:nicotinamidase-related amidase